MSEQNFDNTNEAPENGQAEVSAEEKLGEMMANEGQVEEQTQETEGQTQEQPQQEEQEKIVVGDKEYESYEEAINDYKDKLDRYGDPAELRKKLSQRNDKAKQYEQVENFFKNNPEVAQLMQKYQSDENLKTLVNAYENGYVKKDKLNQIKQRLQQQHQQAQQPQQQQQNQMNNPQQVQQLVNQQLSVYQAKMDAKNQFENLKQQDNYKNYMEENDLDFDRIAEYIAERQLVGENGNIDVEKALNLYAVENNDIQKLINQTAQNDAQKTQQQKQQAQVEKPSAKQPQQQNDNPEVPDWAKEALNYDRGSGSGF